MKVRMHLRSLLALLNGPLLQFLKDLGDRDQEIPSLFSSQLGNYVSELYSFSLSKCGKLLSWSINKVWISSLETQIARGNKSNAHMPISNLFFFLNGMAITNLCSRIYSIEVVWFPIPWRQSGTLMDQSPFSIILCSFLLEILQNSHVNWTSFLF